jgi:aspartate/methionine/tyrosine aminotransferase
MSFARNEALASSYTLTASGMPAADARVFDCLGALDLGYAGTSTLPELRSRIAERYELPPGNVFVTPGASGAMSVLSAALFRPGVRVVVDTPSYEPMRALPRRAGAEVLEIKRQAQSGWCFEVERAESALRGADPGYVSLSTPNNPTGQRTPRAELEALARLAEGVGGALIANEIYEEFVPGPRRLRAAREFDHAISIGSLTKAYGLGALRVGWIALGRGLGHLRAPIEDALFLDCVDLPTTALRAGSLALDREAQLYAPVAALEHSCKPLLVEWLRSTPGFEAQVPEFGLTSFACVFGVQDTLAWARHLASTEDLAVVPGEFFGSPGHVRLSFCQPPERLREALERLRRGRASYAGA